MGKLGFRPGKDTVDYAPKHWGGLIRDYYSNRVRVTQAQALADAAAGKPLNGTAVNKVRLGVRVLVEVVVGRVFVEVVVGCGKRQLCWCHPE